MTALGNYAAIAMANPQTPAAHLERPRGAALTALDFIGGLLIVVLFSAAVVSAVSVCHRSIAACMSRSHGRNSEPAQQQDPPDGASRRRLSCALDRQEGSRGGTRDHHDRLGTAAGCPYLASGSGRTARVRVGHHSLHEGARSGEARLPCADALILAAAGSSIDRVVKCTVILAGREDWRAMNEIYRAYWPGNDFPARTAFEAKLPHPDFLVEIERVAEV
jgi:hypothetical protein